MEKVAIYRQVIQRILSQHETVLCQAKRIHQTETHALFDEHRDRYMLYETGWAGPKRIHVTNIYIRLHNGKIYIEEDWTEDGIATDLLQAGVPREDIVLAFHPPEMRQYTEFAVE